MTAIMRSNAVPKMVDRFDRDLFDFDTIFDNFLPRVAREMTSSRNGNFPPYNIYHDENNIVLEFAVAGFDLNDLDVYTQDKTLIVKGEKAKEEKEEQNGKYTHKGIATRNFEHRFTIGDNIEIEKADYHNGILTVTMKSIEPTRNRIPINNDSSSNGGDEQLLQE